MSRAPGDGAVYTGGCLCGAVHYQARGEPTFQGYCFCKDCRRASGSGFVPFLSFPAEALRVTGRLTHSVVESARGGEAVRNHCAACCSLVFGGILGTDRSHTLYGGSLDDPSLFVPTIAIFLRDKPEWVRIPPGLTTFETLPGQP